MRSENNKLVLFRLIRCCRVLRWRCGRGRGRGRRAGGGLAGGGGAGAADGAVPRGPRAGRRRAGAGAADAAAPPGGGRAPPGALPEPDGATARRTARRGGPPRRRSPPAPPRHPGRVPGRDAAGARRGRLQHRDPLPERHAGLAGLGRGGGGGGVVGAGLPADRRRAHAAAQPGAAVQPRPQRRGAARGTQGRQEAAQCAVVGAACP